MSSARLLFVQHEDEAPPGWFGEWFRRSGVEYDVVHGDRGEEVPTRLDGYAGLVVLGGEMGAHDDADHPWLTPTKQLIATVVPAGQCFLGICLGHQLAAAALGGEVIRNPHGLAMGLTPLARTEAGRHDPLLGPVPNGARTIQWNRDIVSRLPQDATRLATAPDGTVQAARYADRAWGVQFHPEASPALFGTWVGDNLSTSLPPGFDPQHISAEILAAEDELRAAWAPVAGRFADFVKKSADDAASRDELGAVTPASMAS